MNSNDMAERIVDRRTIIKELRDKTHNRSVGLPSGINFTIENKMLKIFIKNPLLNMQEDGAAFEGWILALKAWLSDYIESVELDFEMPKEKLPLYGTSEAGHLNRFLYRIHNMMRLYPNWFRIPESKKQAVNEFVDTIHSESCVINHSLKKRRSVIKSKEMERQIESWFAFHDGKDELARYWGINKEKIFNQLPVGVFYKDIAKGNAVFTRGASAIDLWGVGLDDETLHIIELKCGENAKMGVISETLFYTFLIYDTCIAEEPVFEFGHYGTTEIKDDTSAIINGEKQFKQLFVHILSEKYHVLIVEKVVALINDGLSLFDISFDIAKYNYSEKRIIG